MRTLSAARLRRWLVRLRDVDDQHLPLVGSALWTVEAELRRCTALLPRFPGAVALRLRSWDRRFGSGQRRRTGVGVTALLVAAAAVAVAVTRPPAALRLPAPTTSLACGLTLAAAGTAYAGPRPGEALAAYAQQRRALLARCAAAHPHLIDLAVVSFATALTPAQTRRVVRGYPVVEAFLEQPQAAVRAVPVGASGLRVAMDGLATVLATSARALAMQAVSASPAAVPAGQRTYYDALSRQLFEQAAALRAGCRCVYGVAVTGALPGLAALGRRTGVRLVDPAPAGSRAGRSVLVPLLPGAVVATGLPLVVAVPTPAGGQP